VIRVKRSQLEPLKPLAEGGMAQVFRVGGTVAQVPGELVFKELKASVKATDRPKLLDAMRNSVALRDAMSAKERDELDSVTVWPLAMVEHQGVDVGLLMKCIPPTFFIDALPGPRVFEFQLLCADDSQAQKNGYAKSRAPADKDLVRLALMARLAYAIEVIHRPRGGRRLVYGDLSLRNAAVAANPPKKIPPDILLMDCDGVADESDLTRTQPNTPFFVPPEQKQQKLQDQLTDVYKLGLCVIRGLARGRAATQLTDPASPLIPPCLLDQAGIGLLKRATGVDRSQRPTAEEIKIYLVGRVLDLAEPPTLLTAELSSNVVLRGSEVFVRWTHKGGKSVRIFNDVKNLDEPGIGADAYPNGYPVKPQTACEIWVAVANDHGEDAASAGRLHYYEVPPLKIKVEPPPLSLPDLPALKLPLVRPDIPPYPLYPADAVPLPPLTWPTVPPVKVEEVAPAPRLGNGLLNVVGHAFHKVDAGIDAIVGEVLRREARKLRMKAEKKASTP
jgi:hypothetical protein